MSFFSAINFFFHFCHFLSFFLRQLALLIGPIVLKITANFIAVGQAKKKTKVSAVICTKWILFRDSYARSRPKQKHQLGTTSTATMSYELPGSETRIRDFVVTNQLLIFDCVNYGRSGSGFRKKQPNTKRKPPKNQSKIQSSLVAK